MYSHNGTCGFDYCHVAYGKALRRYDAVIGLPRDTGHYNIGTPSRGDTSISRANKKDI